MRFIQCIVLFACCVSQSDADVTLSSASALDGEGSMRCGTQVTLICKIEPYTGTMSWNIDNTTVMSCTSGSCKTHPPYLPNYGFAFQRANGIFNFTIRPVTFEENGKVFECSDGATSASLTAAVKVVPDNSTSDMNITHTTAGTEVKVTTGCVYPTTNLNFQWYYFKTGLSPVLYTDGTQRDFPVNQSVASCTDGDCGGDGVTQMTSVLVFEEDDTGEDYYLQAVISSSDVLDNVVVTSNITYKLKLSAEDSSWIVDGTPSTGLIIALAVLGVVIVTATVVIYMACHRSEDDSEKEKIIKN